MVRTLETVRERYARRSMLTFLQGKEELPWIKGVIRRSGIGLETARASLTSLNGFGDANKYQQLNEWLDALLRDYRHNA